MGKSSAWVGPAACITSATAMKSQAAVFTQEQLRAEVAAAVAGEEVGLSVSVVLGMTLFYPQDFCTQEPSSSPSHSLPSVWQTGQLLSFSSYPRRRKQGFSTQMRSWTFTNGWEQRAKEQYQHAAFSLRRVPTCFRTDSSLDSHCAHTCPRDVPSPCHIRTLLCNTSHAWHGAAVGPGMKTWGNTVALPGVSTGC